MANPQPLSYQPDTPMDLSAGVSTTSKTSEAPDILIYQMGKEFKVSNELAIPPISHMTLRDIAEALRVILPTLPLPLPESAALT